MVNTELFFFFFTALLIELNYLFYLDLLNVHHNTKEMSMYLFFLPFCLHGII